MQPINALKDYLLKNQITVAIITDPDSITYFTHYACEISERFSALIVSPTLESFFFCPAIEFELVSESEWHGLYFGYTDNQDPYTELLKHIPQQPKAILFEEAHLTIEKADHLKQIFPTASFEKGSTQIKQLRLIKSTEELAILQDAAKLTDDTIAFLAAHLTEGQTERELLTLLDNYLYTQGIYEKAFPPSIYFEGKTLTSNAFVCIDLGVVHHHYCSDITRTLQFGQLTDEQITIYQTVYKAQKEAIAAAKPGVPVSQLDYIARQIIVDAGYGEFYPHRLGHGIGISCHEGPAISKLDRTILQPGMVITIEPGIYVPKLAHVRIEDMLLITEDGHKLLTNYPKKLNYKETE